MKSRLVIPFFYQWLYRVDLERLNAKKNLIDSKNWTKIFIISMVHLSLSSKKFWVLCAFRIYISYWKIYAVKQYLTQPIFQIFMLFQGGKTKTETIKNEEWHFYSGDRRIFIMSNNIYCKYSLMVYCLYIDTYLSLITSSLFYS